MSISHCVRLDGSRDSTIHTKYRISLSSSSIQEPRYQLPRSTTLLGTQGSSTSGEQPCSVYSVPWRPPHQGFVMLPRRPEHARCRDGAVSWADGHHGGAPSKGGASWWHVLGRPYGSVIDNDLSVCSPTETLLRLLIPLNDKVQWTYSRHRGRRTALSARSEHFTGPCNRIVSG